MTHKRPVLHALTSCSVLQFIPAVPNPDPNVIKVSYALTDNYHPAGTQKDHCS